MATLLGATRKSVGLTVLLLLLGCGSSEPPSSEVTEAAGNAPQPGSAAAAQSPSPSDLPGITVSGQKLQTEATADPGLEIVQRYTEMFFSGQTEKLRTKFSDEMKQQFPPGRLDLMRGRVQDSLGEQVQIVGEESQSRGDYRGYVRWARFSKHDGIVEIQWVLRPDDTVAGFFIRDAQADRDAPGRASE